MTENLSESVERLCVDLEAAGFRDAARQLAAVSDAVYTTGSEWLGEVQGTVRDIRRKHRLPPEIDARLKSVLAPPYPERVARRQFWEVTFHATAVLLFVAVVAALVALATEGESAAWLAVIAVCSLVLLLWFSARKISVCPGCGLRSQSLALAFCPHCGMHRYSGVPPPQTRPTPGMAGSTVLVCPSCERPPGGRSRYGRPCPSEGQYCGHCGSHL